MYTWHRVLNYIVITMILFLFLAGTDPNRPIHVLSLNAHPLPIKAPGKLHLSMSFNVTKPLPPTIGMDVAISKYIFGIPLKVPCYKDFGTW